MAHVDNYAKKSIRNVIREHDRLLQKYKNNIDKTKSQLNYQIDDSISVDERIQAINKRVADIMQGRNVQDTTNIVSEWVITCPKEILGNKDKERKFFEVTHDFIAERYGEDNVIGAWVHNDETTPHMHMMFVPEAISRKNGKRTVSSASCITRKDLKTFHDDLDNVTAIAFGQRGIVHNDATLYDKCPTDALKCLTDREKYLKKKERKVKEDREAVERIRDEVAHRYNQLQADQAKFNAMRNAEIKRLQELREKINNEYRKQVEKACDETNEEYYRSYQETLDKLRDIVNQRDYEQLTRDIPHTADAFNMFDKKINTTVVKSKSASGLDIGDSRSALSLSSGGKGLGE